MLKENEKKLLLVELFNFIEDISIGSNDLSEDYVMFKAKRFIPLLKELKNESK